MSDVTNNEKRYQAGSVSERDILAWVDGQVAPGSELDHRVRAYVESRPQLKERIRVWEAQKQAIRAHYAPVFAESVPPALQPTVLRARRRGHWQRRMQLSMAAGVAGVAVIIAVVGMRGESAADPLQSFAQEVAQLGGAATGLSSERTEAAELSEDQSLPDFGLAGFRPSARRDVSAKDLALTEVRYESQDGEALRLFMAREPTSPADEIHELQIDPKDPAATIVYWRQDGWMYALAGDTAASEHLRELAVATLRGDRRRQMAGQSPGNDEDSSMAAAEAVEGSSEAPADAPAAPDREIAPVELPTQPPDGAQPLEYQFEGVSLF